MSKYQWATRPRNYDRERKLYSLPPKPTSEHPLKYSNIPVVKLLAKSSPSSGAGTPRSSTPVDPLGGVGAGAAAAGVQFDPLSSDVIDPLSQLSVADPLNPNNPSTGSALEDAATAASSSSSRPGLLGVDSFEPWSAKRAAILSKFTTFEKLTIASSFFADDAIDSDKLGANATGAGGGGSGSSKTGSASASTTTTTSIVSEKVRHRLEQLDDFEDGSVHELQNLSQREFVGHVDKLKSSMKEFWHQDQKVKALKIAIQCCKMLADTSVIRFYPSKFVLIADILDALGTLVYDRIFARSNQAAGVGSNKTVSKLPPDFNHELVPNAAKEMTRNWFHKIASIRELIPRILCEAAIVRCLNFISPKEEIVKSLSKLASLTRGVGDPLVSIYVKSYLCHVGMDIAFNMPRFLKANNNNGSQDDDDSELHLCTLDHLPYVQTCFRDFLLSYQQLSASSVESVLQAQRVEVLTYRGLYTPALDWIVQCLTFNASERQLVEIVETATTTVPATTSTTASSSTTSSTTTSASPPSKLSGLVLNSFLSSFPTDYIVKRAVLFSSMIKQADDGLFHKPTLYKTFGLCLTMSHEGPAEKRAILNEVWKSLTKISSPGDYISCVEVWIEFVAKHFTAREINFVLSDVIEHLTPDRSFENFCGELVSCISKILVHVTTVGELSQLCSSEKFLPFLDLLQKESVKIEACKILFEAFLRLSGSEMTTDPVLISAVLSLSRSLHDALTPLSLDDERNHATRLIKAFVAKVSFGRDFESQLAFYVQARGAFALLPPVVAQLVHCVNSLAMATLRIAKGVHNKKTSAFVHACAAYSFITVPSLDSPRQQLTLYLESGQVALSNHCYAQAEALFKAAILLLPSASTESWPASPDGAVLNAEALTVEFLRDFLSTLLLAPDNPEQGNPLYLVNGLTNAVKACEGLSIETKCRFNVDVLGILAAFGQESYLYRCRGIDANDVMYGSTTKFLQHLDQLASGVVEEILDHLRDLQSQVASGGIRKIHNHSLAMLGSMAIAADLNDESMIALYANLWSLAAKTVDGEVEAAFVRGRKQRLKELKGKGYAQLLEKISTTATTASATTAVVTPPM